MDKKCCSWPCNSDGVSALHHESDKQKTPRVSGSKRLSSSRFGKEPRGLAGLLGRKFFRYEGLLLWITRSVLNQVPCILLFRFVGILRLNFLTSAIVCFMYHF